MPELRAIIALINSDQFLIGSGLKLILAVRISVDVDGDTFDTQFAIHYLVLTGGSIAAGVVSALDLGGVTERSPPARIAVTSVAASLQYRDEI